MAEEKKYDLSLFGDIQPKLISILVAIVSFATFVQAFINNVHNIFTIPFSGAYGFFIFLYFVIPALCIAYFLFQNKSSIYAGALPLLSRFKVFHYFSLLLATIFIGIGYLLFHSEISLYISKIIITTTIIFTVTIAVSILLYKPARTKAFYRSNAIYATEDKEYILLLIIVIAIGWFYFVYNKNNNHLQKELKPVTNTLEEYNNTNNFKEAARSAIMHISRDQHSVMSRSLLKLSAVNYLNNYSKANSLWQKNTTDSSLRNIIIYADSLLYTNDSLKSDSLKNQLLNNAEDTLKQYADKVINDLYNCFPTPQNNYRTDSLQLFLLKLKLDSYQNAATQIKGAINSRVADDNEKLTKDWLQQMQMLQYKGLLWFFFLIIFLLTLLYYYRKRSSSLPEGKAKSILQKEGNTIKNLLYIVVLLVIPYFKHITEADINLDRPFLNFALADVLPYNSSHEFSEPTRIDTDYTHHLIVIDTNRRLPSYRVDTVKIIADTFLLNQNEEIINYIRLLGKYDIEYPKDRKAYLNAFDSLRTIDSLRKMKK